MKLGFIKPNYPGEKRVVLLPKHINNFENEIYIEKGFGNTLGISDDEYIKKGCKVMSKEEIFNTCDGIFSLKLIKPCDYKYIKEGQIILGWVEPYNTGKEFMKKQALPKNLVIVNLDNIHPSLHYKNKVIPITSIKPNFLIKNNFIAGFASTLHGIMSHGILPNSNTKVAILGSGNVSQGAFSAISKFNADVRMFYRKTMKQFKETLSQYDIIINGVEMDNPKKHILYLEDIKKLKKGSLIIDAAARKEEVIEGAHLTSLENPIYKKDGIYYYSVNNSPTIFYREISKALSEAFSKNVFCKDIKNYLNMIKN